MFRKHRVLALVGLVFVFGLVSAQAASVYPDSWYGNLVQKVQGWFYPGELDRVSGYSNDDANVHVVLIHGIFSHQHNKGQILDSQKAVELWEPLLTYLANDPVDGRNEKLGRCMSFSYFRYDWRKSPWRNAQALRAHCEARSSMSGANTSIILICHSMGGQVGMCERSISGSKVIGLIGCGVPVDGSPLADRKAVYAECRNEVGELAGNLLADRLTGTLDFNCAGMQWLQPVYGPREEVWQNLTFDDSYYFLAGERDAVKPKSFEGAVTLAMLFDASVIEGDSYLTSTELYGYGAYLIENIGYGANDGTVPVDSALARGLGQGAWRFQLVDYDHSQTVRGNSGTKSFEIISDALWELYAKVPNKVVEDFGAVDQIRTDLSWVDDLSGFIPTLKSPIKWWGQEGQNLTVVCQNGKEVSLRVKCQPGYEVDVDFSGWWIAIPTSSGLAVLDLQNGRSLQVVNGDVSAVGWSNQSGVLVYVNEGSIQLLDVNSGFFRTLMVEPTMKFSSRLVVMDDWIYFADQRTTGFDVYRISSKVPTFGDDQVKQLVSNASSPPRRVGDSVVVMTRSDSVTSAKWLYDGGSNQDLELKQILNQGIITGGESPVFAACTDIAMASDGETILLIDGRAVLLNYQEARKYLDEAKDKRSRLALIDKGKWPDTIKIVVDREKLLQDQFPAHSIGGN